MDKSIFTCEHIALNKSIKFPVEGDLYAYSMVGKYDGERGKKRQHLAGHLANCFETELKKLANEGENK